MRGLGTYQISSIIGLNPANTRVRVLWLSGAVTFDTHHSRVGFLPEETYFFQDNGRNMVSSVFFHFLPEEMEEWDL